MLIDAVMSAIAWSAINLSFLTLPMEVASSSSPAYFAIYSVFGGIGGLIGSLVGGAVAKILSSLSFNILGIPIFGIQFMFLAAGFLRASVLRFLLRVRTKRYVPAIRLAINTLSHLSRNNAFRTNGVNMYDLRRVIRKKIESRLEEDKRWRVRRWW